MDAVIKELLTLRVSVARLAQALNVDNHLGVTGKVYEELCATAQQDRGWNALIAECIGAIEEMQRQSEWMSEVCVAYRRHYEEEQIASARSDDMMKGLCE